MERRDPLVIVGGGLAGALAALSVRQHQPDLPLLLLEGGESFGGNHVWSFFDGDIDPSETALVAPLRPVRWPTHHVRFKNRARDLTFGYNSIHSENLDRLVRDRLDPGQFRTNA